MRATILSLEDDVISFRDVKTGTDAVTLVQEKCAGVPTWEILTPKPAFRGQPKAKVASEACYRAVVVRPRPDGGYSVLVCAAEKWVEAAVVMRMEDVVAGGLVITETHHHRKPRGFATCSPAEWSWADGARQCCVTVASGRYVVPAVCFAILAAADAIREEQHREKRRTSVKGSASASSSGSKKGAGPKKERRSPSACDGEKAEKAEKENGAASFWTNFWSFFA